MVSGTPRPHFTPGKDPVPILQEAGWAPGPVWKSRPQRDSIPDRPVCSSVAIPTELPGPHAVQWNSQLHFYKDLKVPQNVSLTLFCILMYSYFFLRYVTFIRCISTYLYCYLLCSMFFNTTNHEIHASIHPIYQCQATCFLHNLSILNCNILPACLKPVYRRHF